MIVSKPPLYGIRLLTALVVCSLWVVGVSPAQVEEVEPAPDGEASAPAKPSAEELKVAFKQLGAEHFATREAASEVVWRAGLEVLPQLEKVMADENDPEVRGRAREIQRHLRRGYIPGLPPETMKMVQMFHDGNRGPGLAALLMADGKGPLVANLLMDEEITQRQEHHDMLEYVTHRVREKAWDLIKKDEEKEGLALFERSYEFTKERIKKHKNEANTWNGFAWDCALSRTHLDEGMKAIDHALRLDPTDYTFLDTKAELLFVSGDRAGAKKWIDRALRLQPRRNPDYYVKQKRRFTFSGFDSRPDF